MEAQNSKFQHGKIYRISDIGYTKFYYGSTVQSLAVRMAEHRRKYKIHRTCQKGTSCTSYQLFEEYGIENCKIELVEAYPCTSKEQLRKGEGYHIQQHECVNKVIPGRTLQEYHQDCKDFISQKCKEYYQHNKEHMQQKRRVYYATSRADRIQKSSIYYNENKADISQQR